MLSMVIAVSAVFCFGAQAFADTLPDGCDFTVSGEGLAFETDYTFENGVLTVELPKMVEDKVKVSRQIDIA